MCVGGEEDEVCGAWRGDTTMETPHAGDEGKEAVRGLL